MKFQVLVSALACVAVSSLAAAEPKVEVLFRCDGTKSGPASQEVISVVRWTNGTNQTIHVEPRLKSFDMSLGWIKATDTASKFKIADDQSEVTLFNYDCGQFLCPPSAKLWPSREGRRVSLTIDATKATGEYVDENFSRGKPNGVRYALRNCQDLRANPEPVTTAPGWVPDSSNPALGKAWRDPDGMVWSEVFPADSYRLGQYSAAAVQKACESFGARLPTRADYERILARLGSEMTLPRRATIPFLGYKLDGDRPYNALLTSSPSGFAPGYTYRLSLSGTTFDGDSHFGDYQCVVDGR